MKQQTRLCAAKRICRVTLSLLLVMVILWGCVERGDPAMTEQFQGTTTTKAVTTVNAATTAEIPTVTPDLSIDSTPPPLSSLPAVSLQLPDLAGYVLTEDGHAYYRTEAKPDEKGGYDLRKEITVDLFRRGYFNQYILSYSSDAPVCAVISYRIQDAQGTTRSHEETFYLEKGQGMEFSSFTDGYLDGEYAYEITGISLRSCNGAYGGFKLHSLTSKCVSVISKEEYFMENDRYRVGILAAWGGGISYIEDKQDGDGELGNLINRADPGRLVQQSYYGVGDGPHYTAGEYGGQKWQYNPVQGGDLYGNGSKLVAFSVSPDGKSLYVKCRPMDWAKNGSLTPSYMENTYTLEKDAILVNNRFVDFFGVQHPAHHAELPAFYVISHLGVFHYYNGTKPWKGDAYISLPDEPFWAGNADAYHNIVKGNTETWAAWTNTTGYGIGLYVPDTQIMLAGRHIYDDSKDPASNSTNYVAPLRTQKIVSYTPFTYDYVITTGSVEEMRSIFQSYRESGVVG